jgi:hypothetical protein
VVDPKKAAGREPLNSDLVRLVEALADANALRDHRMTMAAREAAWKEGRHEARSDLRPVFDGSAK